MKAVTTAIFGFLIALVAYSLIGILWLIYDLQFSLSGVPLGAYSTVLTTKIQEIGFAAIIGAVVTALVIYQVEISQRPK